MNYKKLKQTIAKYYTSSDTIKSIMSGRMRPNADIRYELEKKHKIPFSAWQDIKSYLQEHDTKQSTSKSNTKKQAKV